MTRRTENRLSADRRDAPHSVWVRLGWFVLLWLAGLAAVAILAYGLRAILL